MTPSTPLTIVHHPELGRFETIVDGLRCEADYHLSQGVMHLTHTGVPPALEGRGIAVDETARARILDCMDKATLDRWLLRESRATSLTEVFTED